MFRFTADGTIGHIQELAKGAVRISMFRASGYSRVDRAVARAALLRVRAEPRG